MQFRVCKFLAMRVLNFNRSSLHNFTKITAGVSAQDTLSELSEAFKSANIPEPVLSAELIVGELFGIRNLDILPREIENSQLSVYQSEQLFKMAQCRLARMPIQYILGYWDFREIRLKMRPPVFIPRSETEELVGLVLKHLSCINESNIELLEIGCGSGAISLSLMKEFRTKSSSVNILAVDQSGSACNLTLENALKIELSNVNGKMENAIGGEHINKLEVVNIKLTEDSERNYGLESKVHPNKMDVIVSNPPYVLRKDLAQLDSQITLYEDLRALDGGKDGLLIIENIIMLSNLILKPNCCLFLEIDPCHNFLLPRLLEDINKAPRNGYIMVLKSISKDFQGKDRFAILEKCVL